ncbi:hypothetical protein pb186bvf_016337 [Paramecium bursaria]
MNHQKLKQKQQIIIRYILVKHQVSYLNDLNQGKGSFGCVYKAKDLQQDKKMIAAKQVKIKETNITQQLLKQIEESQEIQVMKSLNNDNIIKFYDLRFTQNNYYMFIEYCDGGTLKQYLSKKPILNDEQIVEFIQQISNGFKELSNNNIMHRDLKPDNILIHQGVYKIADFGFAKFYNGDQNLKQYHTLKGTPMYVAPQLFDERQYSFKSDVWSFGVIIYEMIYGEHPYVDVKTQDQLVQKFKQLKQKAGVVLPTTNRIDALKEFLQKLLMYNEEDRYSWQDIYDHDINKMSAREFLQIISVNRYSQIKKKQPSQPVDSIIPSQIGEFYEKQIQSSSIYQEAIYQMDKLCQDSYRVLKLKSILMLLWKFQIKTLLQIINNVIKLKDRQLQQYQAQFSQQDYCKAVSEYLNNMLRELELGIDLQKFYLEQKFDKSNNHYKEIEKEDYNYFLNQLKMDQTLLNITSIKGVIDVTQQIISYY